MVNRGQDTEKVPADEPKQSTVEPYVNSWVGEMRGIWDEALESCSSQRLLSSLYCTLYGRILLSCWVPGHSYVDKTVIHI